MAKSLQTADVSDALAAPLGDLIAAVGQGMADAQRSLDAASIETMRAMYSGDDRQLNLMRQLGFTPTWYKIPELSAEITVSLSLHGTVNQSDATTSSGLTSNPGRAQLYVTTMDASYQNRFDYDIQAASTLKFRIVPVPPTPQVADTKVVPNLRDKTLAQARALLGQLGIPFQALPPNAADAQKVSSWEPATGDLLAVGQGITLYF